MRSKWQWAGWSVWGVVLIGCTAVWADEPQEQNQPGIAEAFRQPHRVEFHEAPLEEVVQELSEVTGVTLLLDHAALDGMGRDASEPVTLALPTLPLRQALEIMLDRLDLDYAVDGSVVLISTTDALPLETRVYPLAASAVPAEQPEVGWQGRQREHAGPDALITLVTSMVCPTWWRDEGGDGVAMVYGDRLIVYQSPRVHRKILTLLTQLDLLETSDVAQKQPAAPSLRQTAEADPFETRDAPLGDDNPFGLRDVPFGDDNPFDSETDNPFGGPRPN